MLSHLFRLHIFIKVTGSLTPPPSSAQKVTLAAAMALNADMNDAFAALSAFCMRTCERKCVVWMKTGDITSNLGTSHRSLHYWEDAGIIKSARRENGYRYYDKVNQEKINRTLFMYNAASMARHRYDAAIKAGCMHKDSQTNRSSFIPSAEMPAHLFCRFPPAHFVVDFRIPWYYNVGIHHKNGRGIDDGKRKILCRAVVSAR